MADGDEELNLKGPGGLGFSFKGAQMFPVILVLLLGAVFAYLFFQADVKADGRNGYITKAIDAMTASNVKAEATQRAMLYVLSLPQADREKLNLMKPRELQEMQR